MAWQFHLPSPLVLLLGSCQQEKGGGRRHFNAGNATAELTMVDGIPTMTYSGGDICHHNKVHRTTVVSFVCTHQDLSAEAADSFGRPTFDAEDECVYYMSWHTSLACQRQVDQCCLLGLSFQSSCASLLYDSRSSLI
jgi:hypothetical protein